MWRGSDGVIILALPSEINDIRASAAAYLEQYGIVACLQLRGSVLLENRQIVSIPAWRTIARFDEELGLIGLGEPGEAEEELLWVYPVGPGELKVEALEEEN